MASSGSGSGPPVPLKPVLKTDEDGQRTPPASATSKAVQIVEEPQEFTLEDEAGSSSSLRKFKAGSSRRLSGRHAASSSVSSLGEQSPALRPADEPAQASHGHRSQYYSEKLLAQVGDWLEREKRKALARKKRPAHRPRSSPATSATRSPQGQGRQRADSLDSDSSDVSLDRLQRIVENSMSALGLRAMPNLGGAASHRHSRPSRTSSMSKRGLLHRAASSDTDYLDGDAIVPSCDAWLDNTRTLSYGGAGGTASTDDLATLDSMAEAEREAWNVFKNEILRIAHTLRLKGWRRIPLGSGEGLSVERLSGALTNAVYVVTPSSDIPELEGRKPPTRVLLRIYGPQVEHLIDRDNELKVLQRLARKKIGPRLLGTFHNGRFEQFFNATTLTPKDLREPDTMKQIAKRMRELHEGIDLLPQEREAGPAVWKNWDQWLDNVARIISHLDQRLEARAGDLPSETSIHAWMRHGYICGVPWAHFKTAVDKYRQHLYAVYKDSNHVNAQLTFAHNDTQYGNILRLRPDDEKSPLLQPANKHKQLIVIDFEYAAANLRGLEFANHFTEWTYNYHDHLVPWACNTRRYPSIEDQRRFLKAYVDHRPQFPHASSTPKMLAADSRTSTSSSLTSAAPTPPLPPPQLTSNPSSSSIVEFMLDSRAPHGGWHAAEKDREERTEVQVRELLEETKLWRAANSAQWVAWGIVQAKVPGLDDAGSRDENGGSSTPTADDPHSGLAQLPTDNNNNNNREDEGGASGQTDATGSGLFGDRALEEDEEMGVDEFDYLSYAQDRALFFWGDMVRMGLYRLEDLPDKLRQNIKLVEH